VLGLERYRFDETDRNGSMVLPFTPIHHVSTRHDQLLVSDGDRPEVRVLDQNGRLIALYRWSDTVGPPDRATLQNLRDSVLADQQPPDRASYERWFAEMPERPLPAISAMQIDELGYIWMKRYDPSWDNQWTGSVWSKGAGGKWLVLDAEGVWQGVVNMPARFRPFQIGRDFILGVHHDDIGVASVQLYRLNR
jgi:hypothetical protein